MSRPTTIPNTLNTKIWDNVAKAAFQEHGLIVFHEKDGRVPSELREPIRKRFALKYGERV